MFYFDTSTGPLKLLHKLTCSQTGYAKKISKDNELLTGIEPASPHYESGVLPLNYRSLENYNTVYVLLNCSSAIK